MSYGWLSLVPPILAIGLAIKTKTAIPSMLAGILAGYFIYVAFAPDPSKLAVANPLLGAVYETVQALVVAVSDRNAIGLLLFIAILGGIVQILVKAGGAAAFAEWSVEHIHTIRSAQLGTFLMGISILIDDYFNALTVGNVMRPITDRMGLSRAKLAYLIDSTSAPDTILFPMSSWVATCISLITPALINNGFSDWGMSAFLKSIPYNYYSWFTLLFVILVAYWNINMGPMVKFERDALEGHDGSVVEIANEAIEIHHEKARPSDLMAPMIVLALFAVVFMLGTGGFFQGASLIDALMNADSTFALVYAGIATMVFVFALYVPRGLVSVSEYGEAFEEGVQSMVQAMFLLMLAWTVSQLLSDEVLGTGTFVASLVPKSMPGFILPTVMFAVTAFISFTTGVSWGAMAIMIPPAIAVCAKVDPSVISMTMGGVFAGVIFGDHCSPLSDTTILSSTGAGCNHMDHVNSQMPYAITSASVAAVSCTVAGLTHNPFIPMAVGVVLIWGIAWMLHRRGVARGDRLPTDRPKA